MTTRSGRAVVLLLGAGVTAAFAATAVYPLYVARVQTQKRREDAPARESLKKSSMWGEMKR